MFNNKKKIKSGWQKKITKKKSIKKPMKKIIIKPKKISIGEKIIKFIIWIALRLSIRPTHWRDNKKNKEMIDLTYKKIMAPDFLFIPPSFAFYLFMAFMPIIFMVLLIVSQNDTLLTDISNFISKGVKDDDTQKTLLKIRNIVKNITDLSGPESTGNIIKLVFALSLTLWISSAGFAKFVFTQSYIYGHDKFGGYWMNRFRGMFIVCCIALYITGIISFFIFMPHWIEKVLDPAIHKKAYATVITISQIIFTLLFIYLGFIALFKFSPRFKLTWKQIHPGALASTIPISIFILLFSWLTKYIFQYKIYGSLALFMILAATMFQISYFIYVGLLVNAVFYKTHHGNKTYPKRTISRK